MGILSESSIEKELLYMYEHSSSIDEFLQEADDLVDSQGLSDTQYDKVTKRLKLEVLDVNKFVEFNDCKCITNPRAFDQNGIPSSDGLLSNEIFGFTMKERSGIFGYIDLHGYFMDPSCYKTWIRLDPNVKNIIHGAKYYSITPTGEFVEDDNGETGIDFIRENIKKIKFKNSGSRTKQISVRYLEMNRDHMFINKYIVIPPFYRDKNTASSSRKAVGLGGINKLYNNLIVASNALTTMQDMMFDMSEEMKGRVQEIILLIYDWFCGNSNKALEDPGRGLSGKLGLMRMSNMSKTADFSSRLVISPADLKVDRPEDLMIDYDHSAIPLYSAITAFRDFVMYNARLFFENEFRGMTTYPVIDKTGKLKTIVPESPEIVFSDERIKKEMDRFLHGYNNRFVPIQIPVEGTDEVYYMRFKGRYKDQIEEDPNNPITMRRITWCDVFYIAAVEATKDKNVLITRFPIDYFSNQITTGIVISSTKETEEVNIDGEIYKYYPKIREEDIGKDTSNTFVDTLRFGNYYLNGMGGDYDGDQCTCKGVYTREANKELSEYANSKQNFITFGAGPLREPGSDSIQALYALTKILSTVKVTPSDQIQYK